MTKINKSELMTIAHRIKKNLNITMSLALTKAWAKLKEVEISIEKVADKINETFSFWSAKVWVKGNLERVYIGRDGYISIVDGKVVPSLKTNRDNKRITELFA